jgi:hypothetical protein
MGTALSCKGHSEGYVISSWRKGSREIRLQEMRLRDEQPRNLHTAQEELPENMKEGEMLRSNPKDARGA